MSLLGKTVFMSGGSRGIGLAMAKKLASEGANICIAAKTAEPHPKLPGTIYTAAQEIEAAGLSQKCHPHLKKSDNPHILNIAPPLDMSAKWFRHHTAYTMAKYGMSLCTLGMSEEFRKDAIAVNSLWPMTSIDTAAVRNVLGGDSMAKMSRTPDIMADAAYQGL